MVVGDALEELLEDAGAVQEELLRVQEVCAASGVLGRLNEDKWTRRGASKGDILVGDASEELLEDAEAVQEESLRVCRRCVQLLEPLDA